MDLSKSNKRSRASNNDDNGNTHLELTCNESQELLSALHSIQEAFVIIENNKIIHCNKSFEQIFNGRRESIDMTTLKTFQHGTSQNLLDHIQHTKSSGVAEIDIMIFKECESKGLCSIHPLSQDKTLVLIRPNTKNILKNVAWNEFVEEANDVVSLGIEYLPVSPSANLYDGRVVFCTRSFSDLIGLIDDPTGKLLVHELGLSFKVEEWCKLAFSSMSPKERKENFVTCSFKTLEGKTKQIQCWARFVGLSEQQKPLLFINIKDTREVLNVNNSKLLQPLNAADLSVFSNPNTWKKFFDQSAIAMGIVELVNNETDVRIVITNPLGSVGVRPYLSDQIPEDQLKRTIEYYKQARLFQRPVEIEQIYSVKGENTFYTMICFVHIQGPYFLYMSQDITPLKNSREKEQACEQKLALLSADINNTSLFVTEIKTVVSQLEQLLQQCTETTPNAPWLQAAGACCHHLSTIIRSQTVHTVTSDYDLTAVDAPTSLMPSKVPVLDTMQQAKSVVSLPMHNKNIHLDIDCSPDTCFLGFPDALRRLIVNLLFTMTTLSSPNNNLALKVQNGNNNHSLDISITNTDVAMTAKETLHVMERISSLNASVTQNPPDQYQTTVTICHKLLRALDAKLGYDVLTEDATNKLQLTLSIPVNL